MYPFERFTERAKKVLTLAQEEAERANHSYIGSEHLLLGLLRAGDGVAAYVLNDLGVEIDGVRSAIDSLLRGEDLILQEIIPTSRVKKVIEISFEEARRMGSNHVGTEHLLLGLLIEGEGIAAHVLQGLGVSLETARAGIVRAHEKAGAEPALEAGESGSGAEGRPAGEWGPASARIRRTDWPHATGRTSLDPMMQAAERLATEQNTSIGIEHILLAAINTDPLVRRMLAVLGVDDAKLAALRRIATPPPNLVEMRWVYQARIAELRAKRRRDVSRSEQEDLIRLQENLDAAERRWRAGEDQSQQGEDG
jgi:hypothetical protein